MGYELRRVPAHWQHPIDADGAYLPLQSGNLAQEQGDWDVHAAQWRKGLREDPNAPGSWIPLYESDRGTPYEARDGERPDAEDFMPQWSPEECTHYQLYETVTAGTPISPCCASAEELARWLADVGPSVFPKMTGTYEQWLATIKAGDTAIGMQAIPDSSGTHKTIISSDVD